MWFSSVYPIQRHFFLSSLFQFHVDLLLENNDLTKTYTLLFYWCILLIDLNRLIYLWLLLFLLFLLLTIFWKTSCCKIVWLWHQIISSSFSFYKVDFSKFSKKTELFIPLKKCFSKIRFYFFLPLYLYWCMVLTKLINDLMLDLKFLWTKNVIFNQNSWLQVSHIF